MVTLARFLREEGELIRNLVDRSTTRASATVDESSRSSSTMAASCPRSKASQRLPILWFDDDPNATPRKLLILAHGVIVRALFNCDLENIVAAGGIEVQTDLPVLIPNDAWCVHYIKRKSLDEMCELTIDWSGDLTATKVCLAAQKRHGELIWDGCAPRVAEILELNLQVQATLGQRPHQEQARLVADGRPFPLVTISPPRPRSDLPCPSSSPWPHPSRDTRPALTSL